MRLFQATLTALLTGGVLISAAGCAARSPEMYLDDTQKLLESRGGQLKACYDGILKGDKKAAGTVTVKFIVQEDSGKIVKAQVVDGDSTAPPPVRDCVVKSLDGLALKPPDAREGQATFSYQFNINPQKK